MLYIKSGRFYTESISFALPDELCLVTDPYGTSPDTIVFETLDGRFEIEIGACENEDTPLEEVKGFLSYGSHEQVSEIFAVERNGMSGYGAFYRNHGWTHEYYEERLGYPMNDEGQNGFTLAIQHEVEDDSQRNQVESFMAKPNIKEFFDSIRYEPQVCQKVLQGN